MALQTPYVDLQNVTKSFGAQVLFNNISFSVAERQRVGLIAKNGTGKTTLLSIRACCLAERVSWQRVRITKRPLS